MMNYTKVVQDVLKRCLALDNREEDADKSPSVGQDIVISTLIHDVFGGEILKTHKKNGWHFYNRINGERLDFTRSDIKKLTDNKKFEDILSTPAETSDYYDKTDYFTFFMRFVRTLEESVGLDKSQPCLEV